MNRNRVMETFKELVSQFDTEDVKVQLKIKHTYKVASLCEQIAEAQSADVDKAWLLGMLHDIGRFEQLRKYHTFLDAKSEDHAKLSVDLIKKGWFSLDIESEDMCQIVYLHNKLELPSLDADTQMYCDILRDADKIDILRVNRESSFEDIYNVPSQDFYTSEVSDAVMESVKKHQTLDRRLKQTAIDNLVGHISFVFGLVYPKSLELVQEQGYLDEMMHFDTRNEKAKSQFLQIQEEVIHYINQRV